ncbi:MAG: hypothetical protein HQL15_07565, partial [Candidatus Omnitrophica bacterium]|nr:hypothetical protein [Candidatus Omnitrophota bacterium]
MEHRDLASVLQEIAGHILKNKLFLIVPVAVLLLTSGCGMKVVEDG